MGATDNQRIDPRRRVFGHPKSEPPAHRIAPKVCLGEVKRIEHRDDIRDVLGQRIGGTVMRFIARTVTPRIYENETVTSSKGVDVDAGVEAWERGDYAVAYREWRTLADQGDADAQYNLGNMYYNGQGVSQDYAQAHMWLNLAASRFPPGENRDKAVKNRDIVAEMMTPAQISEAQKLVREWRQKK